MAERTRLVDERTRTIPTVRPLHRQQTRSIGPLLPCRFRMFLRQTTTTTTRRPRNPSAKPSRKVVIRRCSEPPSFAVTSLPFEILAEILTRLPSRSLVRFKCVCKSWRHLIEEDPHFIGCHFRNRSRMPHLHVLTFAYMPWLKGRFLHYFEQDCHQINIGNLDPPYGRGISNSCNGLICVSGRSITYVVNPSIRQALQLPESTHPACCHSVALGHDISTGAYKVVGLFVSRPQDLWAMRCMVYTLGLPSGSLPWRYIGKSPFHVDHHLPIFVDGFVVWTIDDYPTRGGPEIAVSFDIKNETFDTIAHPGGGSRCTHSYMIELEGCLCFVDTPDPDSNWHKKNLWILEDCRTRNWIKHAIDLGRIENPSREGVEQHLLLAIRDGRILIHDRLGKFDFYDPVTGCIDRTLHLSYGLAMPYVESLISPVRIHDGRLGSMQWRLPEEEAVRNGKSWRCWQHRQQQSQEGTLSSGCSCTKSHGSWWEWSSINNVDSGVKYSRGQDIRKFLWLYSIPDGFTLYS